METLTFLASDKETVISIQIGRSAKLKPSEGYFLPAENQILLGYERWEEWQSIYGNASKQKAFIETLMQVHRRELTPTK